MRFLSCCLPLAAGVCLMAQTPPQPPSTPQSTIPPPAASDGPSMTTPDGVTLPLQFTPPPVIPPERVVIQVGDVAITSGQMNMILEAYPESQRGYINGPGRAQFIDQVVRVLVLAEEGKRRKIDESEKFKTQLS